MLRLTAYMLSATALAAFQGRAHAQLVDLTLSTSGCVITGDIASVDLFATSDGAQGRAVAAIDTILIWDPAELELLGNDDSFAGYPWFISGFLPEPDGINDTFADGDALYTALASTSGPATAAPSPGLLVTTFRFRTLTATPVAPIAFVATQGVFGQTRVLDYYVPVNDITGDISSTAFVTTCTELGTYYCGNTPNSTGLPGRIVAAVSASVAANDFVLAARDLPPNRFGYFLSSDLPGFLDLPGAGLSDGFFCLGTGPNLGRFNGQVQNSGPFGVFSIPVDLNAVPIAVAPGTIALMPGDTWYFQCWYRDVNNTNNFTDAVRVVFE